MKIKMISTLLSMVILMTAIFPSFFSVYAEDKQAEMQIQTTSNENLARQSGVTYQASSEDPLYPVSKAFDGDRIDWENSRWAAKAFNDQWLEVDFGSVVTFDKIDIYEFDYLKTIRNWRLEYFDGSDWKTIKTGDRFAKGSNVFTFESVQAQKVRLFVVQAEGDFPSICEFEVYNTKEAQPVKNTVSFNSNGGSAVAPLTAIPQESTITLPPPPTRDGYVFLGWYTDNNTYAHEFTNITRVNENTTLYAKWIYAKFSLKSSSEVNKAWLVAHIEFSQNLNLDHYLETGKAELLDALANAEEVSENPSALQEDIDLANHNLKYALYKMRVIPSKDKLEELISN
ncbi:InlB B-repeat-containing protein [Bacillus sp. FJAT-28004]|uniref:InlB B-repeat-containing protein n=1 Tax=Bacillus sp. FJAT-28004 TaxID=1679165 RepID=UPI0006B47607|nr:InlB B-repeat-containing protein [Bacillus sp. FJAT-28004]